SRPDAHHRARYGHGRRGEVQISAGAAVGDAAERADPDSWSEMTFFESSSRSILLLEHDLSENRYPLRIKSGTDFFVIMLQRPVAWISSGGRHYNRLRWAISRVISSGTVASASARRRPASCAAGRERQAFSQRASDGVAVRSISMARLMTAATLRSATVKSRP